MKDTLLIVVSIASLALVGCTKAPSDSSKESAGEVHEAAATAVKAADTPTHTAETHATADDGEGYSCGDRAEGECGSEMEEGGCNQWDEAAAKVMERDLPQDVRWDTFDVEGMTCGGCERRVIANVGELDGVFAVEADAETGKVRVAVASTSDEDKARKAAADRIASLGYRVR